MAGEGDQATSSKEGVAGRWWRGSGALGGEMAEKAGAMLADGDRALEAIH